MRNRSRDDMIALILQAAVEKETRTKIMYKTYLSYRQLKEYLLLLLENELIDYKKGEMSYRTTEKGRHLLEIYNHLSEMVAPKKQNE